MLELVFNFNIRGSAQKRRMIKIRQALSDVSEHFSKQLGYGQIDKKPFNVPEL
jgi:hypothetical protein